MPPSAGTCYTVLYYQTPDKVITWLGLRTSRNTLKHFFLFSIFFPNVRRFFFPPRQTVINEGQKIEFLLPLSSSSTFRPPLPLPPSSPKKGGCLARLMLVLFSSSPVRITPLPPSKTSFSDWEMLPGSLICLLFPHPPPSVSICLSPSPRLFSICKRESLPGRGNDLSSVLGFGEERKERVNWHAATTGLKKKQCPKVRHLWSLYTTELCCGGWQTAIKPSMIMIIPLDLVEKEQGWATKV